MAIHRYWRLSATPTSGTYLQCAELELRETIGGANVAGTGTPIVSSTSSGRPASNAFDNNPATSWASNTQPNGWFIGVDFGAGNERDIQQIAWRAWTANLGENPKDFTAQFSDDGVAWTDQITISGIGAWTSGLQRVYSIVTVPSIAKLSAIDAELHIARSGASPIIRLGAVDAELHLSRSGPSIVDRIGGIALEVHTNLALMTTSRVSAIAIELHIPLRERPLDVLPIPPEASVIEKLDWLTDIIPNYDGTEQRISVRARPRRSLTYDLTLLNDADRKSLYDAYYNSAAYDFYAPTYAYQGWVNTKALAGSNIIKTNVPRSDIREEDEFVVRTRDGLQAVYRVQNRFDDHIVVGRPLTFDVPVGSIVTPVFKSRFQGIASLGMRAIAGSSQLPVQIRSVREQEAYPYTPVTLTTYDGHIVLDRRPTAFTEAAEGFEGGVETVDNETSLPQYYSAWLQTYIGGARSYQINRQFDWMEINFWRTFFDYCRGRQRAFLTSTYRKDQVLATGTVLASNAMTLAGDTYYRLYQNSDTYSRFEIVTDKGTFRVKAFVVSLVAGNTAINFTTAIPDFPIGAVVERVSYLMLARLASDTVTLTHFNGFTSVDTSVRAVSE